MLGDRQLLLGLLALQNGFVSKDQLVSAFAVWTSDKAKSLEQILVEQHSLQANQLELLRALVEVHLQRHNNDAEKSLAALSSLPSIRADLEKLEDSELCDTLTLLQGKDSNTARTTQDATSDARTLPFSRSTSRFRILRPHASGGLGQVFVALDEELHREVAFKEIKQEYADQVESRQRFVREAEITGALEHPSIVPVYGLGTYGDGRPFYAMRFIKGDSLKEWISQFHKTKSQLTPGERSLALRQLLSRFIDVCQAMHYAHSRGVLHRDLKPHNVMLGKYGETLVVDWGLAKTMGEESQASQQDLTSLVKAVRGDSHEVTTQGTALGTPAYMSPEQAEGKLNELGPVSDVYSLGVTLYHSLAGRVPFDQRSSDEVLLAVKKGEFPRPREIDATVPKALESICLKAMRRQPSERYASAEALADDIEHYLADEPVVAHQESVAERVTRFGRKHKSATLTALLSLAIVSLLLASGVWIVTYQRNEAQGLAKKLQRQSASASFEYALNAFSPEQQVGAQEFVRALALSKDDPAKHQEFSQLICNRIEFGDRGQLPFPLKQERSELTIEVSADARRIAAIDSAGRLSIWQSMTGERMGSTIELQAGMSKRNDEHRPGIQANYLLCFSPDGRTLATAQSTPQDSLGASLLRQWNIESGAEVAKRIDVPAQVFELKYVQEGKQLLGRCSGAKSYVQAWHAETGLPVASPIELDLAPHGKMLRRSSDQGKFVMRTEEGAVQVCDPLTAKQVPLPLANAVDGQVSFDGRYGAAFSSAGDLQLFSLESLQPKGEPIPAAQEALFSRDGKSVLVLTRSGARLLSVDTAEELLALPVPSDFDDADMSPDARLLATSHAGRISIWSLVHGKRIADHPVQGSSSVKFSSDGKFLVLRSNNQTIAGSLRIMAPLPQRLKSFSKEPARAYSTIWYSPDSRWIASVSSPVVYLAQTPPPPAPSELVVVSADSLAPAGAPILGWRHDAVAFRSNSKELIAATSFPDRNELHFYDIAHWKPLQTLEIDSGMPSPLCISPDNRFILLSSPSSFPSASQPTSDADQLQLLDLQSRRPVGPPLSHPQFFREGEFSPDSKFLFTLADAQNGLAEDPDQPGFTISKWSCDTGELAYRKKFDELRCVAFNAATSRVLGWQKNVGYRVLDVETEAYLGKPMRFPFGELGSASKFSLDGSLIAVAVENQLQVWDPQSGAKLHEFRIPCDSPDEFATCVALSPDNQSVAVGGFGFSAVYDLSHCALPDDREAFIESILGYRADATGEVFPLSQAEFDEHQLALSQNNHWKSATREFLRDRDLHATRLALRESAEQHHWFATVFHLRAQLAQKPDDPQIAARLQKAESYLPHWDLGLRAMLAEQSNHPMAAVPLLEALLVKFPGDEAIINRLQKAQSDPLTPVESEANAKPQMKAPERSIPGLFPPMPAAPARAAPLAPPPASPTPPPPTPPPPTPPPPAPPVSPAPP